MTHIRAPHLHLAAASSLGVKEARSLASEVGGINAKAAIFVPALLGSMPFFWICIVLALCSFPAVMVAFDNEVAKTGLLSWVPSIITKVSLIALVAWLAQTFIQLVALPVLQVSNNAQMAQQEEHTGEILRGVTLAADRLDLQTEGGMQVLDAKLDRLMAHLQHGSRK